MNSFHVTVISVLDFIKITCAVLGSQAKVTFFFFKVSFYVKGELEDVKDFLS